MPATNKKKQNELEEVILNLETIIQEKDQQLKEYESEVIRLNAVIGQHLETLNRKEAQNEMLRNGLQDKTDTIIRLNSALSIINQAAFSGKAGELNNLKMEITQLHSTIQEKNKTIENLNSLIGQLVEKNNMFPRDSNTNQPDIGPEVRAEPENVEELLVEGTENFAIEETTEGPAIEEEHENVDNPEPQGFQESGWNEGSPDMEEIVTLEVREGVMPTNSPDAVQEPQIQADKTKKKKRKKKYVPHELECQMCCKRFETREELILHRDLEEHHLLYRCNLCHWEFKLRGRLKRHVLNRHSSEIPHKCKRCNMSFKSLFSLLRHEKNEKVHRIKINECPKCKKIFANITPAKLQKHIDSHSSRHTCELCGKTFSTGSYLKVHSNGCSGLKPFNCSFCNKRFVQKSVLVNHERLHTGEMPYSCKICNLQFRTHNVYRKHGLRAHGAENSRDFKQLQEMIIRLETACDMKPDLENKDGKPLFVLPEQIPGLQPEQQPEQQPHQLPEQHCELHPEQQAQQLPQQHTEQHCELHPEQQAQQLPQQHTEQHFELHPEQQPEH